MGLRDLTFGVTELVSHVEKFVDAFDKTTNLAHCWKGNGRHRNQEEMNLICILSFYPVSNALHERVGKQGQKAPG